MFAEKFSEASGLKDEIISLTFSLQRSTANALCASEERENTEKVTGKILKYFHHNKVNVSESYTTAALLRCDDRWWFLRVNSFPARY